MRLLAAVLLLAHGLAHLPHFLGRWRLSARIPYDPTILGGRMNLGNAGTRIVGGLWLLLALDFCFLAWSAYVGAPWLSPAALATAIASLLFCVVAWPDTGIGLFVNAALIVIVVVWSRLG